MRLLLVLLLSEWRDVAEPRTRLAGTGSGSETEPDRCADDLEIWVEADGCGGSSIIRIPLRREVFDVVLPASIILISLWREECECVLPAASSILVSLWRDECECVLPLASIIRMPLRWEPLDMLLRLSWPKLLLMTLVLLRRLWWLFAGLTVEIYSVSSMVMERTVGE